MTPKSQTEDASEKRTPRKTRLAPSPTGALHLGNARTFLATWLLARQSGWRVLLRIEDLDGPRVKRGAAHQAIDDLVWLGLDWDEGPIYQSPRAAIYKSAIDRLVARRRAYPCVCSRREVTLAASAPHAEQVHTIYPGTCRDRYQTVAQAKALSGKAPAIRFHTTIRSVDFEDAFAGPQHFDPARQFGDFVIAKGDGTPAYQIAVVIDDAEMGVTDVVRGDDLLDSTPRQIVLYNALDLAEKIPRYTHLPLVVGSDGKRLAKRHGDSRLAHFREQGVPPARIVALLAKWLGIGDVGDGVPGLASALVERFDLARVPRGQIVYKNELDSPTRASPKCKKPTVKS